MMDKSRMRLAISNCDNVFFVVLMVTGTDSVPWSLYTLSKCPVFMQERVRNNIDGKIHFSNMLEVVGVGGRVCRYEQKTD